MDHGGIVLVVFWFLFIYDDGGVRGFERNSAVLSLRSDRYYGTDRI